MTDKVLPLGDVVGGAGVESGGIRYSNVEKVPRIFLNKEARDVTHPGHVYTT